MKQQTCLLIGIFYLLLSSLQILKADNRENKDTRSISFIVEQEDNVIYLYTTKELTALHIELTDREGNILYTEFSTLPVDTTYPIYIDNLPSGSQYIMIISQGGNRLITYTIYK